MRYETVFYDENIVVTLYTRTTLEIVNIVSSNVTKIYSLRLTLIVTYKKPLSYLILSKC